MHPIISAILLLMVLASGALATGRVATLDDGNMLFFVTNDGSFGFDKDETLDDVGGLYYPKRTLNVFMAGAGIWVAGKVGDQWRVSIAGGPSEFVPGPAYSFDTLASEFPVYKLTRGEDQYLSDDFRNWPSQLGAPTDALGVPLIKGSQAVFSLCSDTDTAAHRFDISDSDPLGVEVRLYAYTFDNDYQLFDTMLTQVVMLEYTVTNITNHSIDSCIVTCYADPDIGYSGDDMVASDSAGRSCYCYNETSFDVYFGHNPPVIGLTLLGGELASTNFYHSRSDYDTLPQSVFLMSGLDLEGAPYFDSTAQQNTRFPYNGDPVTQTGWLPEEPRDFRLMLNLPVIDLPPGDSRSFKAALILCHSESVLNSVADFRETARKLLDLESIGPTLEFATGVSSAFDVSEPIIGNDWGGRFLYGGLDLASRYLGYEDPAWAFPDVSLLFTNEPSQSALRFSPDHGHFIYRDQKSLPIEVIDNSGNADCGLAFLDLDDDGSCINSDGFADPLLVLVDPLSTVLLEPPVMTIEALYDRLAYALVLSDTPYALAGRRLTVYSSGLTGEFGIADSLIDFGDVMLGTVGERVLELRNSSLFAQHVTLKASSGGELLIHPVSLDLGAGERAYVQLQYLPDRMGEYHAPLMVESSGFTCETTAFELSARAIEFRGQGDVDGDGVIDLTDLVGLVQMLFADERITLSARELDANCDGIFNLSDLVGFVNAAFFATETVCR